MYRNIKLVLGQRELLEDPGRYQRPVGKLNYLTITRSDISFAITVVIQFLQAPCKDHWDAVIRILKYIKRAPEQGLLYEDKGHADIIGYCDADWSGSLTDRRSTFGSRISSYGPCFMRAYLVETTSSRVEIC
uniref:Reverse transcriptase Ty1/copia-type domain-containing protein n=1 Tax=Solanum lycopersicum TaxID=4081 RepID=A0A3Q7IGA5_SOLLC